MQQNYRPLTGKQGLLLLNGIKQNKVYKFANLEVLGECINPSELGFYEGYTDQLAKLEAEQYKLKESQEKSEL